jgi:hypothetical protein
MDGYCTTIYKIYKKKKIYKLQGELPHIICVVVLIGIIIQRITAVHASARAHGAAGFQSLEARAVVRAAVDPAFALLLLLPLLGGSGWYHCRWVGILRHQG